MSFGEHMESGNGIASLISVQPCVRAPVCTLAGAGNGKNKSPAGVLRPAASCTPGPNSHSTLTAFHAHTGQRLWCLHIPACEHAVCTVPETGLL